MGIKSNLMNDEKIEIVLKIKKIKNSKNF